MSRTPSDTRPIRVLFACGGTGGHVYPAIAIADAVRALRPEAAVQFAGTQDRMEWEAVPKAGYPIYPITVSGFQRGLSPEALSRNLSFPFKLGKGFADALALVRHFDPDVVVGTGGYVSGPVGLAAKLHGRPLFLQEQNAYAGATNKLLARFAERVFTAFPAANAYFPDGVTEVSGNPVRQDLTAADRDAARAHFEVPEGARVLLAMGGSLGAGPINDALEQHLAALLEDEALVVVWQTGKRYYEGVRRLIADTLGDHPRLRLLQYLDRMDYAYAAADLAVTRAGAITCSELAVTRTPAVLVPSPNVTADHQTKNARALADEGAAVLLPEGRLQAEFLSTVRGLLHDGARRAEMQAAAARLARPDAAADIARAVVAAADRRSVDSRVDNSFDV